MGYCLEFAVFQSRWATFLGVGLGKGLSLDLVPEAILSQWDATGRDSMVRSSVAEWWEFERSLVDWDEEHFAQLMGIELADVGYVLVTDEGYRQNCVFQFQGYEWKAFVAWYEQYFAMDFLQPADYLLFTQNFSKVVILHHDGFLFEGR